MKNIFKILSYTRQFWKWYLYMGFFVISMSLLSLATPILMKQIVDAIVDQVSGRTTNMNTIILFLGFIIITDIVITTFSAFSMWIGDILSVKLHTFLTKTFYAHLLALDIGYYDNEVTGKIVNKMYRGIESITQFIQSMLNNFLPFFLTAFMTIVLLSYYSFFIAFLLASLFPLYILISHKSSQAWEKFEDKKNAIGDGSQGRVFESISGIRVVKAFAAELTELAAFVKARGQIETHTASQTKQWHFYDFLRRLTLNLILFGILSYIVYWTFYGRYTIGEMTLLIQLVQQARFPLFAMSFILGQIQYASAGSRDFFSILDTDVKIKDVPDATKVEIKNIHKQSLIEFKNISFQYDKGKKVIHRISFSVNGGEKLALVGESGQGKSTLVNLLLRFYEPQEGIIQICGKDITKLTQKSIHDNIAVVFQESLLFSGTISENIRYGKPDATNDEVIEAAKAANAYDFICSLTNGMESVVGERGVKLSGGQKQRIAIARAILKDAPIIILDEATSALDSRAEIEVQRGLDRLMKGRTSIIIAHRLSTIAGADKILVLSKGMIAEYGNPGVLLKSKNGLYAQMVELQKKLLTASPQEKEEALRKFDLVA